MQGLVKLLCVADDAEIIAERPLQLAELSFAASDRFEVLHEAAEVVADTDGPLEHPLNLREMRILARIDHRQRVFQALFARLIVRLVPLAKDIERFAPAGVFELLALVEPLEEGPQ